MGGHRELYMESISRVEVLAGPGGKRHWPDEVKGRIVAETLVSGVKVSEVARRHDLRPNHLSAWRRLAKDGVFAIPDLAGASFAPIVVAAPEPRPILATGGPIELIVGKVTLRLDAATDARRIVELVAALQVAS